MVSQEDDLYIFEESQRSLSDYPSSHDSAPFVRSWPQASLSTDSNLTIYRWAGAYLCDIA